MNHARPTQEDVVADAMEAKEAKEGVVETLMDEVKVAEDKAEVVDETTDDRTTIHHRLNGLQLQNVGTVEKLATFQKTVRNQRKRNDVVATMHRPSQNTTLMTMPMMRRATAADE